jgi:hypothetical protein
MKDAAAEKPPVIGYSAEGHLIRGTCRGKKGTWLLPFSADESVVVRMANPLDKKVFGATADDPVVVLFKWGGSSSRRYLARDTSFMSVPPEVADDDELLEKLMSEWAAREDGDNE